jgi:peptidoglycan hydrolase-like protein with peptidoglycan-binding domain
MLGASGTAVFDQQTRKAVNRFQRQQGWDPSGVGPETWNRLDNHAGSPGRRPNLVAGDRGPGVRLLQDMLGVAGTAIFESATRKAADDFQRTQGWEPSGVGPMTWEALDRRSSTFGSANAQQSTGTGLVGALVVGGKFLGDVQKFKKGGELALHGADVVAKGVRATIGGTEIVKDVAIAAEVGSAGSGGAGGGAAAALVVAQVGVAMVGVAIGAGITLSPIAIVHAQEVGDTLGEFGGNLPPGGAPCPQCKNFHPGTTPDYGVCDDFLRPRGIRAILKGRPDTGTPADNSILPPGWTGGGKDSANQARAHLLGDKLGGSGSEPRNLVTFDQGANVRMFNEFEKEAIEIAIAIANGTRICFEYIVTPEYLRIPKSTTDRSALMPHRITGTLINLCTGEILINRRFVDNLLPH